METVAYAVYLWLVYTYGEHEEGTQGTGAPDKEVVEDAVPGEGLGEKLKALSESRTVYGRVAGVATLLAFTTAQITFWKTVLYWLNEAFSGKRHISTVPEQLPPQASRTNCSALLCLGFDNIGHNSWSNLIFLWIIPNGAWLVLPAYMMYVFGREILQGLDLAAGGNGAKRQ